MTPWGKTSFVPSAIIEQFLKFRETMLHTKFLISRPCIFSRSFKFLLYVYNEN
jgi:hypothetical protein